MLLLVFKILLPIILVGQIVLFFRLRKLKGRTSLRKQAHEDYAKYGGELELDNYCNGIWFEHGREVYEKYLPKHNLNMFIMSYMAIVNIVVLFFT